MKKWIRCVGWMFVVVIYVVLGLALVAAGSYAGDSENFALLAGVVFVGAPLLFGTMFYVIGLAMDA